MQRVIEKFTRFYYNHQSSVKLVSMQNVKLNGGFAYVVTRYHYLQRKQIFTGSLSD